MTNALDSITATAKSAKILFISAALWLVLGFLPFDSELFAEEAKAASCPPRTKSYIVPFAIFAGICGFAFVFGRLANRKERKNQEKFLARLASVAPGDGVVTLGGLCVTVIAVDGKVLTVALAPGVEGKVCLEAIVAVVKLNDNQPELDDIQGLRGVFPRA